MLLLIFALLFLVLFAGLVWASVIRRARRDEAEMRRVCDELMVRNRTRAQRVVSSKSGPVVWPDDDDYNQSPP